MGPPSPPAIAVEGRRRLDADEEEARKGRKKNEKCVWLWRTFSKKLWLWRTEQMWS